MSDVIANVGGNLGLFLGGSVMAGLGGIVDMIMKLHEKKPKDIRFF